MTSAIHIQQLREWASSMPINNTNDTATADDVEVFDEEPCVEVEEVEQTVDNVPDHIKKFVLESIEQNIRQRNPSTATQTKLSSQQQRYQDNTKPCEEFLWLLLEPFGVLLRFLQHMYFEFCRRFCY